MNALLLIALATTSHFACKDQGNSSFRPYYVQVTSTGAKEFPPLGQNAMTSQGECEQAIAAANQEHGVICSRTGLDGWKPTLYTGTVPGRPDFGYLGGSSIMNFEDCLSATRHSSEKGVCFWGGSDWYVSPIDHEDVSAGPFSSIESCVKATSRD